jgi:hypothetical protein
MSLPMSLPLCVSELCASSVAPLGFSGSRSAVPPVLASVLCLVGTSSCPVFVGCAQGVDGSVRAELGAHRLQVFTVCRDSGRGGFAARSIEFVRALAASGGSLLSFPSGVCPTGLIPSCSASRCFSGFGSGSWATLSLAVGLGVPCFVFLGSFVAASGWGLVSVLPPSGWGLVPLGLGWWASSPAPSQSCLF